MFSQVVDHIASLQKIIWCSGCRCELAYFIGVGPEEKEDYCPQCYREKLIK